MEYKDYYKALGVERDADQDAIKKAYRKLAVKYHPDKNQGNTASEDMFKQVSEAYEVVGDVEKRKKYDQLGSNWKQYENTGGGQYSGFGSGDSSDFFESFFGRSSGRSKSYGRRGDPFGQRPRRGGDLRTDIDLTVQEAFVGAERILSVNGEKLKLKIKPGAYTGLELRVKQKGEPGSFGGAPGDVFVNIRIIEDSQYSVEDSNLKTVHQIDVLTAVLGGKTTVQSLSGAMSIPVAPGTQNGKMLRLKGKGFPVYGQEGVFGDFIVQLNIAIPESLTEKQKELYEQLRDLD